MTFSSSDRDQSRADSFAAIILAAGQGTRMKATLPKVVHTVLGRPLLLWPLHALEGAGVADTAVVLSQRYPSVVDLVQEFAESSSGHIGVCFQNEARGTGHAAQIGLDALKGLSARPRDVLVTMGDAPLVRSSTFAEFMVSHRQSGAAVSLLAFTARDPTGYGRVLHSSSGEFEAIREEKDCTEVERSVTLCHSGILAMREDVAELLLSEIDADNKAGEYYLTSVAGGAKRRGLSVHVFRGASEEEVGGVNSQSQLASAAAVLQRRVLEHWMAQGVQFESPQNVHVDVGVRFGVDVLVEPFVCLRSGCVVPDGVRVPSGFGISPEGQTVFVRRSDLR